MRHPVQYAVLGATLMVAALFSGPATAQSDRNAAHVIVIGVDGLSSDGVTKANVPNLKEMMAKGSWTLNARGVLPTTSSANWASILTGAGPEQHGVINNDWRLSEFSIPSSVIGSGNFYPSIFQVLREQRADWKLASIYHWSGFSNLYDHQFVNYDANGKTEDDTATLAVEYVKTQKPAFLFVHFDNIDHVGHAAGHGTPKYYEAVSQVDKSIGRIRQATVDAGIAEKTVIIVTSDHGGVGKGHGGATLAEIEVPWIVYGAGIKPGVRLDMPINTIDTPSTVAWLLGAEAPYAWIGRPIKAVRQGEAIPAQTYKTSSFFAAPVIEPEAIGNAPAGGLFVDKSAQLRIRNPNNTGEVRYTLDGSTPTPHSPVYVAPVPIARSTIVRAGLFIDGRPASVPATGYFRVLNKEDAANRGLGYKIYLLPDEPARMPELTGLKASASGRTHEISIDALPLPRDNKIAVAFDGFIHIKNAGTYTFALASDDGSKLYIDGKTVVDNDGQHGVISANGEIELQAGKHAIRVEYFNAGGGAWLGTYFEGPGIPRQLLDPNWLSPE